MMLQEGIKRLLADNSFFNPVQFNPQEGCYIYGAGDLGRLAIEYCEACNLPIIGLLDQNRCGVLNSKQGKAYKIEKPTAVAASNKKIPVGVAIITQPYEPIRDHLYQCGWAHVFPFCSLASGYLNGHPLRSGWVLGEVTKEEVKSVEWLCGNWSDDHSHKHYEAFIAWHRSNRELDVNPYTIKTDGRYVIPEVLNALSFRRKAFVDVGSHHAEAMIKFQKSGVIFNSYHLFEPDGTSNAFLNANYPEFLPRGSTITIANDVLGKNKTRAPFQEGLGYCSQLWGESDKQRDVVTLDSFRLSPDFLKVHTEGSENAVLQGAKETVLRSRPCIAYSVYHRRDGFCNDIIKPMEIFPDYNWFFRLHSYQGCGAFVYAIPNKAC